MSVLRILILAALAMSAGSSLFCQTVKGTIVGTITDSTGAVVANVGVQATEMRTNIGRSVETNENGYYVFALMDPGTYRIEAARPGFKKATREGADLAPNTTMRVDFVLEVGALTESIEVSASAGVLQTDRVDIGRKIESKALQDMPLAYNRNYQGLLSLTPGVGRAFRPHSEFYNSQDSLSVRVNGQPRQYNNFQLEGLDNNWDNGNLTVLVPPIEAIATVDVATANYDAEFGRATGAVTNVTLRSGTNDLHGSAFAFNRVSRLAAKNVFSQTKAPITYNLYGGTLGGPLRKNKLFFFGDYQGVSDHLGSTTRATIPTMDFRTGDLREAPTTIYDPLTGNADGTGRTPFAGKIIPASRISPIARRILDGIPAATFSGTGTNYEANLARVKTSSLFDIKVDGQITENDSAFVRYSYQRPVLKDPPLFGMFGGPRNGGFAGTGKARIQSAGANYSHIFSPTFLTEVRFGFMRVRNDARTSDYLLTTARDIGIPGVNIDDWSTGMSSINISGYSSPVVGFSGSLPWIRAQNVFNGVSIWTKIVNNHLIKFGVDARRERNDLLETWAGARGTFNFTAGPTARSGDPAVGFGNAFGAFLLDMPNSFGRHLRVIFPTVRQTLLFSFISDKWQVTPNLTLDLGLRHEWWPARSPRSNSPWIKSKHFEVETS